MQDISPTAIVAKLDKENEVRVGRVILPLMAAHASRDNFECALAPLAFQLSANQLKDSFDRIVAKLHLSDFASVAFDAQGKVAVVIPASAVAAPAVKALITPLLTEIHNKTRQPN